MQTNTVSVYGYRFPWATGKATIVAGDITAWRTVHYARGYDNHAHSSASNLIGNVKLVSPVLTRFTRPSGSYQTGGIAILKIKFLPEPQTWAMLVAGAALLGVGYRMRGR
jgi:hypothetical protein